ncbi:MAG: DUF6056 family protein [Kofleriaceae bacterium]
MRRLITIQAAIWAAIVGPIWIVMIACTHWEPVQRDGWGHFLWHEHVGLSLGHLWTYAKGMYVHNNPRLGQVLTLLLFTPGPWHAIVTPIVELAMFYLLAALVLGRWPSVRRTDDALLFLVIVALVSLTAPQFGLMLFYRPYTGNYLFGLVLNLAFLIPYRFYLEAPRTRGWWWIPILVVLGFASGMANEHTGPAVVAAAAVVTIVTWRRDRAIAWWAIAGLVAMIAGGITLFEAPGQAIRYQGLASHASLLGRIVERGLVADLKMFGTLGYLTETLPWVVIAVVASRAVRPAPAPRTRRWTELALLATGLLIVVTLLVSPKVGPRLYLGSFAFACAGIAGFVVRRLTTRWATAAVAGLSALWLVYAGYQCLTAYHEVGREFTARLELLEHAPPNSVLDLPSYTVERSRWVLDEDLRDPRIRNTVAFSFGLALIRLDGVGVADVPVPEDP